MFIEKGFLDRTQPNDIDCCPKTWRSNVYPEGDSSKNQIGVTAIEFFFAS